MGESRWSDELEDGFNNLDVAMTETIQAGMTVGSARRIAECILALRELRERMEAELALVDAKADAPEETSG